MNNLETSITFQNLIKSFEVEAALFFRYRFFSTIASFEDENTALAMLEKVMASQHDYVLGSLDFLRDYKDPSSLVPIGSTFQNLASLLQTEIEQSSEIYPQMAKVAREEGFTDIASWFDTLEKAKRVHVQNFQKVKDA